jgi:hypothetical protein
MLCWLRAGHVKALKRIGVHLGAGNFGARTKAVFLGAPLAWVDGGRGVARIEQGSSLSAASGMTEGLSLA